MEYGLTVDGGEGHIPNASTDAQEGGGGRVATAVLGRVGVEACHVGDSPYE